MSSGFSVQAGNFPSEGFTVKSVAGCRLVFGAVPMNDFGMLTHGFTKKALIAIDVADRIGASFVIGEPGDLEVLRKMDLPVSEKRDFESKAALALGLPEVAEWLRNGERGTSSNAMCSAIFGVPVKAGRAHPCDPDDLRRCLVFLDATGAHDKVHMMATASPIWSRLVDVWGSLTSSYAKEREAGCSAPETAGLLRAAIEGVAPAPEKARRRPGV